MREATLLLGYCGSDIGIKPLRSTTVSIFPTSPIGAGVWKNGSSEQGLQISSSLSLYWAYALHVRECNKAKLAAKVNVALKMRVLAGYRLISIPPHRAAIGVASRILILYTTSGCD